MFLKICSKVLKISFMKMFFFSFQVDEAPATNGTKNGKESSKEPDSIDDDEDDVDIDDI